VLSKRFPKVKQFDLVLIKWNDAHNLASDWTNLTALPELKVDCVIETVGRYLKSTATQSVFCADMSIDDGDEVILNTIFAIPHACIETIEVLRSDK
jgi:hypothetical protein